MSKKETDAHLEELRRRLAETTEKSNKLTSENARLTKQVAGLQADQDRLLQEAKAAAAYRTKVQELLRAVQDENEKVRAEADAKIAAAELRGRESNESARRILEDVQGKIDRFSEDSKKQAEAVGAINEENAKLREQLLKFAEASSLESKHHEAQVKALQLEKQLAEARQAQAEENARLSTETTTKMKEVLEKAIEEHQAISKQNGQLRNENAALKKDTAGILELVTKSNASLKEFGEIRAQLQRQLEAVTADRDALAASLLLEKKKASKLSEVSRSLQTQRDDLQAELDRTALVLEAALDKLAGRARALGGIDGLSIADVSAHGSADGSVPGQLAPLRPQAMEAAGGAGEQPVPAEAGAAGAAPPSAGGQEHATKQASKPGKKDDAFSAEGLANRLYALLNSNSSSGLFAGPSREQAVGET